MLTNHPKVRVAIYVTALAAQVAAFFVAIASPELGAAFDASAQLLAGVAGVTAIANLHTTEIDSGSSATAASTPSADSWPGRV